MKKLFLLFTVLICLPGCIASQAFRTYEVRKGRQVAEAKAGVVLLLEHWDFRAGVIEELLASRKSQLSADAVTALEDINALSSKYQADKILTNYEYGRVLGLILKIRYSVAQKLLDIYLPNLFQYIPVTL